MPSVLILLPTYNEAVNIQRVLREIRAHIPAHILVIDDNSPDGTGRLVSELARTTEGLFVLHRAKKLGLASAYKEGFQFALEKRYDLIVQMDSDLSHDPAYLSQLISYAGDYDVVIGSRYTPGGSLVGMRWWRRMLSRLGNLYVLYLLSSREAAFQIRDATAGFVCWRADVLRSVVSPRVLFRGYAFQVELKWRACKLGASIKEVPILFRDRVLGKSKLSPNMVAEAVLLPFRL